MIATGTHPAFSYMFKENSMESIQVDRSKLSGPTTETSTLGTSSNAVASISAISHETSLLGTSKPESPAEPESSDEEDSFYTETMIALHALHLQALQNNPYYLEHYFSTNSKFSLSGDAASPKVLFRSLSGNSARYRIMLGLCVLLLAVLGSSLEYSRDFSTDEHFPQPFDPRLPIIAIMGKTGSGKSSFIDKLGGRNIENGERAEIGHGLRACTANMSLYEVSISGNPAYLIDSPGFDDTTLSDTAVLRKISATLVSFYKKEKKLNGLIYLHDISGARMGGSALRNLQMFQQLCGDDALSRVMLVTTKWGVSTSKSQQALLRERERELETAFWKYMLSKGSKMQRHDDTAASATSVTRGLLGTETILTALQHEIVDLKMSFENTGAAKIGLEALEEYKTTTEKEMRFLRETIKSQSKLDNEARQQLRDEFKILQNQLKQMKNEKDALIVGWKAAEQSAESHLDRIVDTPVLMNDKARVPKTRLFISGR